MEIKTILPSAVTARVKTFCYPKQCCRGSVIRFVTDHRFCGGGLLAPPPSPQAGEPPPVGCPRLLIQYIRSYPLYLEAIILPVVLHGCESWSLILREEHRLRVFENRVLRRIFGPKRDEVKGE
jgi:hypothetical protein